MLNISEIFNKYGRPKGVIHIGSQFLFARNFYLQYNLTNTIWIESNPFFYQHCLNMLIGSGENIFNYFIGTVPVNFNIIVNNEHQETMTVDKIHLNDLCSQNNININQYNFLNLCLQGNAELSFEGLDVENFDYILTEASDEASEGFNINLKYIDKYLSQFRFKRVEKNFNTNIGQAFYIKKRKYTKKVS